MSRLLSPPASARTGPLARIAEWVPINNDPELTGTPIGARSDAPTGESDAGNSQDQPPKSREATVEDIDRLETLKLEDLDVDFSGVKIPESGRLTDDDMQVAVDSFMASLRER